MVSIGFSLQHSPSLALPPPPSSHLSPMTPDSNKWCGAWGHCSSGRPGGLEQGSKRNKGETAYDQWPLTKEWDRFLWHPLTPHPLTQCYKLAAPWSSACCTIFFSFMFYYHKDNWAREPWTVKRTVFSFNLPPYTSTRGENQHASLRDHMHSSAAAQPSKVMQMRDDSVIVWGISME